MAGRIRSIKPEVLDDEPMAQLSDGAWRLYIASWVLADDHGLFRAGARILAADVWQDTGKTEHAEEALSELRRKGFLRAYEVNGQRYAQIKPHAWKRHQRIDHPGKPRVPEPNDSNYLDGVSRTLSDGLGDPRPSRARGGSPISDLRSPTTDHDVSAGVSEKPSKPSEVPPPESVEPEEPEVPNTESGFDLAKRIWQELWSACYREPYEFTFDLSPNGDDRVLQRAGHRAQERATADVSAEAILRHKMTGYLRDASRWASDNRHPARGLEKDWNKYGMPRAPSSLTRIAKAKPAELQLSNDELKRIAQENLARLKAPGGLFAKKGSER